MHSLSEIVMALVGAGLTLETFIEHPTSGDPYFPFLVEGAKDEWQTPEGYPSLPLSLTLTCRRSPRAGAGGIRGD